MSWCGLAVRHLAGKQKDLGSIRFSSPFSSFKNCGLWTLSYDFAHTINETLKGLVGHDGIGGGKMNTYVSQHIRTLCVFQ